MKTKKAAVLPAARQNELHCKAYRNCYTQSREKLKQQIGQLLLYLQIPLNESDKQNYWRVFESGLRQLVDMKVCEANYE